MGAQNDEIAIVSVTSQPVGSQASATDNTQHTTHNIVADPHVKKVITLLAEDLKHPWPVQELATKVLLTRRQLERLFRQELAQTPSQYLLRQRMEKACELLVTSLDQVKKIAQEVGMPDVNHFIRVFKKQHGKTPEVYRQEASLERISTDVAFV